jgi:hypothetical protein
MLSLMPWLEIEATTEEMTHFRDARCCVRVDGCDDERPKAYGLEVAVTECEMWRFRRLYKTSLLEPVR